MAVQNIIGRYSSTLSGSYTSGGGSISVTSASGLPTGACNFYAIVKAEGANTEEVFLVTNVSGTTLTVTGAQEGSSASNHASGATIIAGIVTTTFIKQLGYVLVEEHTASSSSELDFTTGITSDFSDYMIVYEQLLLQTNAVQLQMNMSTNGGSSYDTGANYYWTQWNMKLGTTGTGTNGANADSAFQTTGATAANGQPIDGSFNLYLPGGSQSYKRIIGNVIFEYSGDSGQYGTLFWGAYNNSTAVNAFRIKPGSGNIVSGTVRLFGQAK